MVFIFDLCVKGTSVDFFKNYIVTNWRCNPSCVESLSLKFYEGLEGRNLTYCWNYTNYFIQVQSFITWIRGMIAYWNLTITCNLGIMYKMHVIFFILFFVASCSIHLQLLVGSTWELVCQIVVWRRKKIVRVFKKWWWLVNLCGNWAFIFFGFNFFMRM